MEKNKHQRWSTFDPPVRAGKLISVYCSCVVTDSSVQSSHARGTLRRSRAVPILTGRVGTAGGRKDEPGPILPPPYELSSLYDPGPEPKTGLVQ